MLKQSLRATILELYLKGVSKRKIARLLKIARNTVNSVISSQTAQPPRIQRPEKGQPHRDEILEMHHLYRGNMVRVHEELQAQGVRMSYPALTGFCRRHGIGTKPKQPAGRYHFQPGQEMQHDTSPHTTEINDKKCNIQTASVVLCYSRMVFFQCYPRFTRFECKLFLTEALRYFAGAPGVVMIDNTNVVVLSGTGRDMVPVPEMEAFAERYSFLFRAHAPGHADRSARVERPFHYFENNFLVGRSFADWDELNATARRWCDEKNGSYKRHLKARPIELYTIERAELRPLPEWVPEPYLLHHRIVDVHGYVTVHTNRYSVPTDWIGRQIQVCETAREIVVTLGRDSVTHVRQIGLKDQWSTLSEHRSRRRKKASDPPQELNALQRRAPELKSYVDNLKKRCRKPFVLALRQLLRMVDDYPRKPLLDAIRDAEHYGLYDLDRLEIMVLQRIDRDFFPLTNLGERDDD